MPTPARVPQSVPVHPAVWQLLQTVAEALDALTGTFARGQPADEAAPAESAAIAMLGKRLKTTCQEALRRLRPRFEQWLAQHPAPPPEVARTVSEALAAEARQPVNGHAAALWLIYRSEDALAGPILLRKYQVEDGRRVPAGKWLACASVEAARGRLPPGLALLPREPGEPASVLEVWR